MTESLFKSFDPFAYSVNNVSALDGEVVVAFQENDTNKIKEIINTGSPITVDVFITIDKHLHACILIALTGNDSKFDDIQEMLENPKSHRVNYAVGALICVMRKSNRKHTKYLSNTTFSKDS